VECGEAEADEKKVKVMCLVKILEGDRWSEGVIEGRASNSGSE
jgi:hypothetical protein